MRRFLCLLAVSLPFCANADEIRQAFTQNQQQLNQWQQQNQQRWLQQHAFESPQFATVNENFAQQCLPYAQLKLRGVSLIEAAPFLPKVGECLNEIRLNQLREQITQAYLKKGFVHNPMQFEDDQSGTLWLHVFEGKIATQTNDFHLPLAQIFSGSLGQPLKIADLDQALDQANQVIGNQVSVDVLPAKNGEIALIWQNQPSSRISGGLSVDNLATKSYRRWQTRANFALGNPFNFADMLYVSASHTLHSAQKFNRSALLYYQIPYRYWTFSSWLSFAQFQTKLPLQSTTLTQQGKTWQGALNADYVVARGANFVSHLSSQLEQIRSQNQLENEILWLQSPRLMSASLAWNHLQLLENGFGQIQGRIERGKNSAPHQAAPHFSRVTLEAQWQHQHQFLAQNWRISHQLSAQYSRDLLPAIKQADLTGRFQVRGLNDFSQSAEKSAVLQTNLAWLKSTKWGEFSPYFGVDVGVQRANATNSPSEKATAYALGAKWQHRHFQTTIEWAKGRFWSAEQTRKAAFWLVDWRWTF